MAINTFDARSAIAAIKDLLTSMMEESLKTKKTESERSFSARSYTSVINALGRLKVIDRPSIEKTLPASGKIRVAVLSWLNENLIMVPKETDGTPLGVCPGFGPVALKKYADAGYHTVEDVISAKASGELPFKLTTLQSSCLDRCRLLREPIPRAAITHFANQVETKKVSAEDGGVIVVGSYRRGNAHSNDMDIAIVIPIGMEKDIGAYFKAKVERLVTKMAAVESAPNTRLSGGESKSAYIFETDVTGSRCVLHVDFFALLGSYLGPGLLHYTGPAGFNINLRTKIHDIVKETNPKAKPVVSQYGISGVTYPEEINLTEESFLSAFGLPYIAPKFRTADYIW